MKIGPASKATTHESREEFSASDDDDDDDVEDEGEADEPSFESRSFCTTTPAAFKQSHQQTQKCIHSSWTYTGHLKFPEALQEIDNKMIHEVHGHTDRE